MTTMFAFLGDRLTVWTARERREGYREALGAAGLPRDVRLERPTSTAWVRHKTRCWA